MKEKELYDYFCEHKNKWLSVNDICRNVYDVYLAEDLTIKSTAPIARQLRKDVRSINFGDFEGVIISSNKGYKLAVNSAEAQRYIDSRFKRDFKNLKLTWILKKKVGNNGQFKYNDEELLKAIDTYLKGD